MQFNWLNYHKLELSLPSFLVLVLKGLGKNTPSINRSNGDVDSYSIDSDKPAILFFSHNLFHSLSILSKNRRSDAA
jgi:hypothetical protein